MRPSYLKCRVQHDSWNPSCVPIGLQAKTKRSTPQRTKPKRIAFWTKTSRAGFPTSSREWIGSSASRDPSPFPNPSFAVDPPSFYCQAADRAPYWWRTPRSSAFCAASASHSSPSLPQTYPPRSSVTRRRESDIHQFFFLFDVNFLVSLALGFLIFINSCFFF